MVKAELEPKFGGSGDLLNEIRILIEDARRQTAAAVNVGLTALYWQIGKRILREVLGNKRAKYGDPIVATLWRQLVAEFGRNRGNVTPAMLLKDPYILDFLGLADRYLERDLEDAILRELETFLLELGAGFSFVARQKRIQLDGEDFYIDLLFYNRKLKRLIVVDLSREASSLSTRVRWSFIFAGWRSTRQNSANRARWALFCAPGRTLSRSSCLNSGRRAFTSLNTSRFYLLPRFSGRSCTKLSKQLG